MNLESLVTKDYLESRLDARFAMQKAYMETRIAQLEGKIDGNHRFLMFTQAIIIAAVVLPQVHRLIVI